ncbi:MAG: hypothetical protein ACI9SP_002248 [Arenicella sp.]
MEKIFLLFENIEGHQNCGSQNLNFKIIILCLLVSGCVSIQTDIITAEQYEQWASDCNDLYQSKELAGAIYNTTQCKAVRSYEQENHWADYQWPSQFSEHRQTCSKDSHCKIVMTSYNSGCGSELTDPILYSTQIVRGENRQKMLELATHKIAQEKSLYKIQSGLEVCTLVAPKPPVGICWQSECEMIWTWRRK